MRGGDPDAAYDRWLSCIEPDRRDLLAPFAASRMVMWPISARVNAVVNDNADLLAPFDL
jgi:putative SOS response-associated peptidase YedK